MTSFPSTVAERAAPPAQAASLESAPPLVPGVDRRLVWALALGLAAVPALIAVVQLGRLHPDEVYQTLEPAFYRAFGYGVLAWEWREGLRNWAVPLFLSALFRLGAALGIEHPVGLRALAELPQWLLHAASLVAVYRFSARRTQGPGALFAMALVGLYAPVLSFAGRTLGESFSTSFLLLGLERLDALSPRARVSLAGEGSVPWSPGERFSAGAGGALLGLAVVSRYGSAVMALAAVGWLAAFRPWRQAAWAAAGGLAVALLLGLLDWATWGKPFHSFVAYVQFNVLSGQAAAQFGAEPPAFYLLPLLLWAPGWSWLGLAASWRQGWAAGLDSVARRFPLPLACGLAYLVAVSSTAHKEHRFLYPALVLWAMAAAAPLVASGMSVLKGRGLRAGAAAVALCLSLGPYFVEGPFSVQRPDQFQAIVRATRGNATGLLIVNEGLWGSGGFFYIGKQIPWYTCDWPRDAAFQAAMRDARFNRVVSYDDRALAELQAAGFRITERLGRAVLLARP